MPGNRTLPRGNSASEPVSAMGQTVLCDPMATAVGGSLAPELLARIIAIGDGPGVRGVSLLGSVARGEATAWSDIDIESTVIDPAAKWDTRPSFLGDRLVMSHSITPAEQCRQVE